jgi:PHD/YefM family antitoxin component YafN of YafNO toxin-antitoxin module
MTTLFKSYELPIAYSMIATARKIKPRRDGSHSFQQYFLYWTAFNNIYTTIAHRKGHRTLVKRNDDGSVVTIANGNVRIPEVVVVSEREQIQLAIQEFDEDLKRKLIDHAGTKYFLGRIPYWEGKQIETDAFGQRLNGVINVDYTTDRQYPVWSPIDFQCYEAYLENPENEENRDFLARQIVDLFYTIRCNLMHGSKKFDDANDLTVIENALPMLELIVTSFTR